LWGRGVICVKNIIASTECSGIYKLTCRTCHKVNNKPPEVSQPDTANTNATSKTITPNPYKHYTSCKTYTNTVQLTTLRHYSVPYKTPLCFFHKNSNTYTNMYHRNGKLICKQQRGDPNPLLQLALDTCKTTHTVHIGQHPLTGTRTTVYTQTVPWKDRPHQTTGHQNAHFR
jgi:hypothetical protein